MGNSKTFDANSNTKTIPHHNPNNVTNITNPSTKKKKSKKLKSNGWIQRKFGKKLGIHASYRIIRAKWMNLNELLMIIKIPLVSKITIWKLTIDIIHKDSN